LTCRRRWFNREKRKPQKQQDVEIATKQSMDKDKTVFVAPTTNKPWSFLFASTFETSSESERSEMLLGTRSVSDPSPLEDPKNRKN
jgi:hypothetical protein